MTVLTNHLRDGNFIQSEGNGRLSRDQVTIHGGFTGAVALKAGTVLGKITSGGKYTISPHSGSDGSQTGIAILFNDCDPTNGDVLATIFTGPGEVDGNALIYDSTVTAGAFTVTKNAELLAVGIKVRS
jgi:hypothetical protein